MTKLALYVPLEAKPGKEERSPNFSDQPYRWSMPSPVHGRRRHWHRSPRPSIRGPTMSAAYPPLNELPSH